MLITPRCARIAAAGAVGAGALTSALLFGGTPIAQAAPPATVTSFAERLRGLPRDPYRGTRQGGANRR
ncbi:hypothetical protein [Mycobacterium asiaticum]|uniref:Uncharacterized protein n=1 Tax=Mycobacterium asiaticum TaxID=1790 RepID=A0A1A3CWR4_MYCAS|nr:hypothetical protein [Mycobacterium asiaticum]OBI90506.1 hypothetical protein A9X01_11700 [Mycobacterium asiaticum]